MKIKDFENMVIYKATNPDNIKGEAASFETGTKPTYHVDSSPLSEDEIKDFKQLYDNDFGARNERVLDYNHPEYIKSGINKVDWGKEASDFPHAEALAPGEVISRYGNDSGKYFGDIGTDFDSRQLPYSEDKLAPKYYEVIKPFSVEQSTIAEQKKWNDSEVTHTAQQYKTNESEEWLRNNGYIREISKEKAYELCPSGKTGISDKRGSRSLNYDLNNADLFNENKKGDYTYGKTEYGKVAFGNLKLETGKRDSAAQRTVGNDDRRPTDDGGHLIGTRFDGDSGQKNMDAQERNLNRGSYKIRENDWAESLENGDKVFVNIESYKSNNSDRPDAFMGYSISEHTDGTREWDAFSYQNESAATQEEWNRTIEENDSEDQYNNPIDYNPADYADELSDNDYIVNDNSQPKEMPTENAEEDVSSLKENATTAEEQPKNSENAGEEASPENAKEQNGKSDSKGEAAGTDKDNRQKNGEYEESNDNEKSLPENREETSLPKENTPTAEEQPKNSENAGEEALPENTKESRDNSDSKGETAGTDEDNRQKNGEYEENNDNKKSLPENREETSLPKENTPTAEEQPKNGKNAGEEASHENTKESRDNSDSKGETAGTDKESGNNKERSTKNNEEGTALPKEKNSQKQTEDKPHTNDRQKNDENTAKETPPKENADSKEALKNNKDHEKSEPSENEHSENKRIADGKGASNDNASGKQDTSGNKNQSEEAGKEIPSEGKSKPAKEDAPDKSTENKQSDAAQHKNDGAQNADYDNYYCYGY